MPELSFAIDGLYAAGWWPSKSDDCHQFEDGRWYPSSDHILTVFQDSEIETLLSTPECGHPVTIRWTSARIGSCSVMASTRAEALILAYTQWLRSNKQISRSHTRSS